MNLSQIRRILLIIVSCVLVIDGGLLLFVKFSGEKKSGNTIDIVAFSQAETHASQLKQQFVDEGLNVSVIKVKHEFETPKGFKVVLRNDDETILEPVYAALIFKKQPVNYADKKKCIMYGKVYPDKAKADAAVKKVKDVAGVAFEVEPNLVKVNKDAYKMVIKEIPEEMEGDLMARLTDSTFVDIVVKPNVTVAESSGSEAEPAEEDGAKSE